MLPQILTVNPMRKRRYRVKNRHYRHVRRVKNPHSKHHYRARRAHRSHRRRVANPLRVGKGFLPSKREWVGVGVGAAGAAGVDVALAYFSPYLPVFLQSGWGRIGTQVVGSILMGLAAGKVFDREIGKAVTAGALVITAYSSLRTVLAPTLGNSIKGLSGLADFSDFTPTSWSGGYAVGANMGGAPGMGAYMRNPGMGAYLTSTNAPPRIGMGAYMNPGSFLSKNRVGAYMAQNGFGGYDSDQM